MDRFDTAQKIKLFIKDFFRKCDQIRSLESFKCYVKLQGEGEGGRVANFVTNHYRN